RTEHLHAHFAAGAALDALRLGDLLDLPVSVTAHAYDIFALPRDLEDKLARAAFTTSGCAYTVETLRRIAGPQHAGRVHEIVMGIDPERFRRRTPHAPATTVLAVGRLVPKKGFADLVAAVGLLRDRGRAPARTVIVGDGPLREELRATIETAGLDGLVELAGARSQEEVRALLEEAAVLAMPCVVAPDGDRDSMPVVVKEALAMEVPVVASDEVGLPEVVRPGWGRLHPPGDRQALAGALEELLALAPAQRVAMGRAGRAFVSEHCHVDREAARLVELIRGVQAPPRCAARSAKRWLRATDAKPAGSS
ncbi:MAG TPA: glycosyltransferase, partial [Solirubrobacteraceae bacterium]|nr:glycosyltransferase [Solirubrobacteraceae bacterium]